MEYRQPTAWQRGCWRHKIRTNQHIRLMFFDEIGQLEFFPSEIIQVIAKLLDFRIEEFVGFVSGLCFGLMGKYPFDLRMWVFPGSFGQLHHVGFDPSGGDVEVLEVEEDFQERRLFFGEKIVDLSGKW